MKQSIKVLGIWALTGLFFASSSWAITVEVSNAPSDDLPLTLEAIQSAQKSLILNAYELTSAPIADALIARVQAGVHVEVLQEGQLVGGLSAAAKAIQSHIVQAMQAAAGHDRFFEMSSKSGAKRRYRFDHAKYAVIDGSSLLIGSENYSPTGNPKPGSLGNRGWEVFIHDSAIAKEYEAVFATDTNTSFGDVTDLVASGSNLLKVAFKKTPTTPLPAAGAPTLLQASAVQKVTSPDTSLNGLVDLINSAKVSLQIEQMTFDSSWNANTPSSPLLDAVLAAARRGVQVEVLLNDERSFTHGAPVPKPKNAPTVDTLNQAAQSEGIRLSARIANLKAMGVDFIHNKGMIVDGDRVLISSINWDQNSVTNNREAAVVLSSPSIAKYYQALFESDWSVSGGMKLSATTNPLASQTILSSPVLPDANLQDCPATLHVEARIDALTLADSADEDFAALSDHKLRGRFKRLASPHGCIFENEAPSQETGERQTLELRKKSDGTRSIIFEGYTPKTDKIFSIRAVLGKSDAQADWLGSSPAFIYEGSGTSERLGKATIDLEN